MKNRFIIIGLSAVLVTFGAFGQTQSSVAANTTTATGGATVGNPTTASGQAPANVRTNVNAGVNDNPNNNSTPPGAAAGVNGSAVVIAAGTVDAGGNPQMFVGGTDTGGGNIISATDPRTRASTGGGFTNNALGFTNNMPGATNRGTMSRPGSQNGNIRVLDNPTATGGGVNRQP
jgi:hypothetical protein